MKVLPVLALLLIVGCATPVSTTTTTKTEDPVQSFQRQVSQGKDRAEAIGWAITSQSIDVRKTDSLVSPHEGILSFTALKKSRDLNKPKHDDEFNIKLRFSISVGKWQILSGKYEYLLEYQLSNGKYEHPLIHKDNWNDLPIDSSGHWKDYTVGETLRTITDCFR